MKDLNKIFDSFIKLNETWSREPGEPSRLLANRTAFYKKLIKELYEVQPEVIFSYLLDIHIKLTVIESTQPRHSHMLHDSNNFIERLISKHTKEYILEISEEKILNQHNEELEKLVIDE